MSAKKENTKQTSSSHPRRLSEANPPEKTCSPTQTADMNQGLEVASINDTDLEFEVVVEAENNTSEALEFGKFLLHEKLGEGASAIVVRATHKETRRSVALKIFRRGEKCHRFVREKEVIERLAHPNIALHFGFGKHGSHHFVSMEIVYGADLERQVAQRGLLPLNDVLTMIFQVALGLEHAHHRGLVHRDVKPSNIIVDDVGLAKLLDLGVSRDIKFDTGRDIESPITVGATIEFMPPEIFNTDAVSPASDLFSLGATAYFLLTGEFIVPGETQEDRISNLKSGVYNGLDALNLEPDVQTIFAKLLNTDIDSRYEHAGDLISDLCRVMSDRGIPIPKRSVKVLIIEDNEIDLLLTVRILEKTNPSVEVTRASTLSDAINSIQATNFDLVLLDLNLPDSEGLETVFRFAEANGDNVPLIVVSGEEISANDFENKISGFINKNSLDPTSLERTIFLAHARNRAR